MTTPTTTEKVESIESIVPKEQTVPRITMEDMKREEQGMIIEIAKNPKDSRLYEVLGDLYVRMNNFSDAKESFEAAMELSPHDEGLQKKYSQVLKKMVI